MKTGEKIYQFGSQELRLMRGLNLSYNAQIGLLLLQKEKEMSLEYGMGLSMGSMFEKLEIIV